MSGLRPEIWIPEIKQNFYRYAMFLNRSRDFSPYVLNDAINLAQQGASPNVYKNPEGAIPKVNRTDSAIVLGLDSYVTDTMAVELFEQLQYAYDKRADIINQFGLVLNQKISDDAAYAWSPSQDGTYTPVISTSGSNRTDGTSFKAISIQDFARMQEAFDTKLFPKQGRVAVLHPKHKQELMSQDALLFKQFSNLKTGEFLPLFGFEVYDYPNTPVFNKNTGVKAAYGAAAAPSTDSISSFFYCESEVFRAEGTMLLRYMPASMNTNTVGDEMGMAWRYGVNTIRQRAYGAIYSAVSA